MLLHLIIVSSWTLRFIHEAPLFTLSLQSVINGDQAFVLRAPILRNSLPTELRRIMSLTALKSLQNSSPCESLWKCWNLTIPFMYIYLLLLVLQSSFSMHTFSGSFGLISFIPFCKAFWTTENYAIQIKLIMYGPLTLFFLFQVLTVWNRCSLPSLFNATHLNANFTATKTSRSPNLRHLVWSLLAFSLLLPAAFVSQNKGHLNWKSEFGWKPW